MWSRTLALCLVALLPGLVSAHDYVYEAASVPLALGATVNRPFDINNAGQVVGETFTAGGMCGFVWDETLGVRLLCGPSDEQAFAIAVNDDGVIVGAYVGPIGFRPCLWIGTDYCLDLGMPMQATGLPVGIGEDGSVLGNFQLPGEKTAPFRWTNPLGFEILSLSPFLDFNQLTSVARDGTALGFGLKRMTVKGTAGPFLVRGTTLSYLQAPPEIRQLVPRAMNDHGDVAGWILADGMAEPCVWHEGEGIHKLTLPPGYEGGHGLDINGDGDIVGGTESPGTGWVSGHHGLLDLDLLPPPGETAPQVVNAFGINDDGTILASSAGPQGTVLTRSVVEWTEGRIVAITRGSLVAGDEPALRATDAETATFAGGPSAGRYAAALEFVMEGTTTFSSPTRLVFRAVARHGYERNARLQVQLWDWGASRFGTEEWIDRDVSAPRFGLFDLVVDNGASRYIEPGSRRMRARVRVLPFGNALPFHVEFEQLSWFAG